MATGLPIDEAYAKASRWLGSRREPHVDRRIAEPELIDVVHAVCRLLQNGTFSPATLESAYGFVVNLVWGEDEFGEQDQILADLAYRAWNEFRRRGDERAMKDWQGRCVQRVLKQEVLRDFLALPIQSRSPNLTERFLADKPVLLAACISLEKSRNTKPVVAAREAKQMHEWLVSELASHPSEEISYFAGRVAYSAAGCSRHLGHFREHDSWLEVARAHFDNTLSPGPMLARVEWSRLVALHDLHRVHGILDEIRSVTAAFKRYEMDLDELKGIVLEASVLKAMNRRVEALERLEVVRYAAAATEDSLMLGLTLASIAELVAESGNPQKGLLLMREALSLMGESSGPVGLGGIHVLTAELFRNEGNLEAASREYALAVAIYQAGGLSFQEAYMRVVRSETLLAGGCEDEALAELASALPVVMREEAWVDGVAAITLLKESLRRKRADPSAIAFLRECLVSVKRGN